MLARGALCRLAAETPKQAAPSLPKLACLVQTARAGYALPIRTLLHASQLQVRSYATKDPAEPVKKAVKAKAAAGQSVTKTTSSKKPAVKKTAAKKTTAKKTAAKKPAAKKAAPKKTKKKAVPKKPVKRAKKVLTAEEKEKALIRELKKLALREPVTRNPISAYNLFFAERVKTAHKEGGKPDFTDSTKSWAAITPAERENWNHQAAEANEARAAEYKKWVLSHTPDQIRIANNARARLRRTLSATRKTPGIPAHCQSIVDERAVKRPVSAWTAFNVERSPSSDFKGLLLPQVSKLLSEEWKALSASEKQRFEDIASADKQRYANEMAAQTKA
ncbi:hypothetical protein C7974DRAFT_403213 [Boeremia exigua]|uniref:uncharacterized protein n=1 Tax=Boeremia exigua TaxID=749465 RepID=UPI001E8DB9E1|nr:uncharacterized protein C7974DRAFT_403213 [Boeremia exigua]KAH6615077.1 hypothetical protein C7974DRAFT_403213 [Boeremia exigua]